jgi:hypothetical protein
MWLEEIAEERLIKGADRNPEQGELVFSVRDAKPRTR